MSCHLSKGNYTWTVFDRTALRVCGTGSRPKYFTLNSREPRRSIYATSLTRRRNRSRYTSSTGQLPDPQLRNFTEEPI